MAGAKISALAAAADVAAEDLLAIVDDPSGTPATKKATVTQLATFLRSLAETLTNKTIALGSNTVTGTSAQLATAISDETGSGSLVFANTPTLVTPVIGAATGTSLAASSFLSVGATPATVGALRLPNGGLSGVGWIYAKDTGATDRKVAGITDSNTVELGGGDLPAYVRGTAAGGVHLSVPGGTLSVYSDRVEFPNQAALPWFKDSNGTSWYKFAVSDLAADRTITLPLLTGNDDFVFAAHSQTLTNKTINGSSNTITNVPISTGVSGLGAGVATFLATPSGENLATALTTALPATKGGTGLTALGTGVATFLGTPSSANLIAAITDETGTGSLVFGTSPTISAPTLSSTPVLSGASASTSNNAKGTETNVNPVNVQTTDATVTTLDSFTIASDSVVGVTWMVVATQSTVGQAAMYSCSAVFRNAGGVVTQVGTTTTTVVGEDTASWNATIDNSTTTIRLRVTGAAGTTIQWSSVCTRLAVVP